MVSALEKGKVYSNYLQNASGKTISAPYVLRAHPERRLGHASQVGKKSVPGLKPHNFISPTCSDV